MAKAKLRNRTAKIIKNIDAPHESIDVPKSACLIQEIEESQYDLDRIDWALELLDDIMDDQGKVDAHWDQDATYKRLSLVYFWIKDHVEAIKGRADSMVDEHYRVA